MPRTNFTKNELVSYAGWGHQSWCGQCAIKDPQLQREYDERVALKHGDDYVWSPARLNDWGRQHDLPTYARQTIYKHRDHVANPKDKFVTAVARRNAVSVTAPRKTSDDDFLAAVIAEGQRRVEQNPEEVTIDQAIRATQVRAQVKAGGRDQMNILVQIFTALPEPDLPVIEGEAVEVS